MGNFVFNAHRLEDKADRHEDKADRHEDNVDRHEEAVTSTGEGVGTGRKTDLSPCSASSPYTSSRIQSMLESRSNFPDETAFAIESSKVHWSELHPASDSDDQHSPESDRLYFDEVLKKHPVWGGSRFFKDFDDLDIRLKLAEGAQGEVYFAKRTSCGGQYAVKLFKKGFPLRLLLQQMPTSMLSLGSPFEYLLGGTMMKDERFKNRFAFVMECQRCDLRTLIDCQMSSKNNQGPPFTMGLTTKFLHKIAEDMKSLHHRYGIIHKDLKASNVLVANHPIMILYEDVGFGHQTVVVSDFECSEIGVVGTRFWRAPEILHQLKNRTSPLQFTKQCDVYSFAMLAYELVTGKIPFEDQASSDYGVVLSGGRPELPEDLEFSLKHIITECWHPEPSERPDFLDLENRLRRLLSRYKREGWVNAKYGTGATYCEENNIRYTGWSVSFNPTPPKETQSSSQIQSGVTFASDVQIQ